jgi:YegS/Rv2252/BmrU family lipid kinase
MELRRICIVHNPGAGRRSGGALTRSVAQRLREMGHAVRVDATHAPGHASELAERAISDGFDLVVAAGGDGTVSEVLQPLAGTSVIMGAIPAGTVNLWATEAGLPAQADSLARLFSAGHARSMDVGRVGDRRFLLMASLGLDAAAVQAMNLQLKRRIGRLAYGVSVLSLGAKYRGTPVRISLDGRVVNCTALVMVVGNTRRYAGPFFATPHAIADDGMLDVAVLRGDGVLEGLGQLGAIMTRSPALRRSMLYGRARVIEVESERPIPMQVDGDFYGFAPARFEALPSALRVVTGVPQAGLFGREVTGESDMGHMMLTAGLEHGARHAEAG